MVQHYTHLYLCNTILLITAESENFASGASVFTEVANFRKAPLVVWVIDN